MSFKVVCARRIPREWSAWLSSRGVDPAGADEDLPADRFRAMSREAEGILCFLTDKIDAGLLEACGRLRIVASVAAGLDHVDVGAASRRGIWVTHTPGALTEATADLAWGLLLAAARRLVEADRFVREGRFEGWRFDLFQGLELSGAALGIVGFGRIGQAVARRARGFGMRLAALARPSFDPKAWPDVEALVLDDLVARSDVLTLHVPLTDRTRGMIGERELRRMKPTAVLVNVARGPVVDEGALVRALREGWIAGAALDVFENEPALSPGLTELPNAVLAPHIGSATSAARERMMRMACEDLAAVAAGKRPRYPANEVESKK